MSPISKTNDSRSSTTHTKNTKSPKEATEVTTEKKPVAKKAAAAKKSTAIQGVIEGVEVVPTPPRKKSALGSITFIAAGPGDPELLTMRAVRLLGSADKIVADSQAMQIALA